MPSMSAIGDLTPAPASDTDFQGIAGDAYSEQRMARYEGALCAQSDPEVFFPEKGESSKNAKLICAACPCRDLCLEDALVNDEQHGIWGGLSYPERCRVARGSESPHRQHIA